MDGDRVTVWVLANEAGRVTIPRAFTDREVGEEWLAIYRVLNPDAPSVMLVERDVPRSALTED